MTTCMILHTSDTHLGARQYGLIEREQDVYDVFDEIIEIAVRERVDVVVHSGDFFDTTRPPMQAVRVAIDALKKLAEHGIPLVSILGDHDIPRRRELPPLYLLEHVSSNMVVVGKLAQEDTWVRRVKGRRGECAIAGVFSHRGTRAKALRLVLSRKLSGRKWDIPSILVLHQGLRGAAPEYELELTDLPEGYSYYALGHVHTHMRFNVNGTVAAYPGSSEYLRMDELGKPKLVLLVEVGVKGVVSIQEVKLARVRPQIVYEVNVETVEDDVRGVIKDIVSRRLSKKPLVHVVVKGANSTSSRRKVRQALEQLSRLVLDYRIIFEKGENAVAGIGLEEAKAVVLDLRSLLEEKLKDTDTVELALSLLNVLGYGGATESVREAQRIVEEWFYKKYGVRP